MEAFVNDSTIESTNEQVQEDFLRFEYSSREQFPYIAINIDWEMKKDL